MSEPELRLSNLYQLRPRASNQSDLCIWTHPVDCNSSSSIRTNHKLTFPSSSSRTAVRSRSVVKSSATKLARPCVPGCEAVTGAGHDVRTFLLHGVNVSGLPLDADVASVLQAAAGEPRAQPRHGRWARALSVRGAPCSGSRSRGHTS